MPTPTNSDASPSTCTPEARVADAIRKVTATMQRELDSGARGTRMDANDVIDILLAIADDIAAP